MKIPKYFYFRVKTDGKGVFIEIEDASDVDVAEVVRCGECKHMTANGTCKMFASDNIFPLACDYCSYGERPATIETEVARG